MQTGIKQGYGKTGFAVLFGLDEIIKKQNAKRPATAFTACCKALFSLDLFDNPFAAVFSNLFPYSCVSSPCNPQRIAASCFLAVQKNIPKIRRLRVIEQVY